MKYVALVGCICAALSALLGVLGMPPNGTLWAFTAFLWSGIVTVEEFRRV